MGATNRPQDVDPAIMRRLSARFPIPVPSESQREQILRVAFLCCSVSLQRKSFRSSCGARTYRIVSILRRSLLWLRVWQDQIWRRSAGCFPWIFNETQIIVKVCRLAVLSRAKATLADQGSLRNRQPIEDDDLEMALLKYSRAYQHMTEHGLD